MFDSLLPNVISWIGILLMAIGTVLVVRVHARDVIAGKGRRLIPGLVAIEAGLTLYMAALWTDLVLGGDTWIPGAIIATIVWAVSAAFMVRTFRRVVRDDVEADRRE